ncbi:MAG: YbaK/EbsC family protein [Acidaminococcaceae bacterium]|nr:YbaK/EbsC family protein [Acidaminococcaceae bacterium]HAY60682.1 EBSC protein [Acidaminococcaceae bacterium]HCJ91105.1 EBSC protein [Acidaminococcaceae bacterium]
MSVERARKYLAKFGLEDRIITFRTSSATVELAAQAAGTEPCRIAKSMSFQSKEGPVLIITAGDTKIDNAKFKHFFSVKPKMLPFEDVEPLIGHAVGGVCPFGVNPGVRVYLDISMKRFETVFPAAGEENNAIELTPEELEKYTENEGWVDLCKGWQPQE